MDLPGAQLKLAITQAVAPRPEMVMAMVEVNAARGGRTLHNHAAHLPVGVRDAIVSHVTDPARLAASAQARLLFSW
jgi:hypothetical protein